MRRNHVALKVQYAALMDRDTAILALSIGARVKQERQSRGWTLDQLAEVAGMSRRMVVNVEQGAANPSVGTLLRISDALGIGLPSLVQRPQPKPVKVTRAGEGAACGSVSLAGAGVLVAGTEPPDVVELWDWTPWAWRHATPARPLPGTKELMQVWKGTRHARGGGPVGQAGDGVAFTGDVGHSYANPGAQLARFSLAVFEPGVGSVPVGGPTVAEVDMLPGVLGRCAGRRRRVRAAAGLPSSAARRRRARARPER